MILTSLPNHIATVLRGGLRSTAATRAVAEWSSDPTWRILVLEGGVGSGKTAAASWGFQFVYDRMTRPGVRTYAEIYSPRWPVWCDARLVCGLVGVEWRYEDKWAAFDTAPLVVLDDVGTEDKPERMTSLLERLFNVASSRAIITTNLDLDDFHKRYGDRVDSRIVGFAQWVQCADADMRVCPPDGAPFARPEDETHSELVARLKAEEERRKIDEEWEAGHEERQRWWAEHMADLARLTGEKRLRVAASGESDEEARERIRRQVEQLQRDRGKAG